MDKSKKINDHIRTGWIRKFISEEPLTLPIGIRLFLINLQFLDRFDLSLLRDRFLIYLHWSLNFSSKFGEWPLRAQDETVLYSHLKITSKRMEDNAIPIPFFLMSIHATRSDLKSVFNLMTVDGRLGLLNWWQTSQNHEMKSLTYPSNSELAKLLSYPWDSFNISEDTLVYLYSPWSKNPIIPHFLGCIWESRADLKSIYDAKSENGAIYLIEWWCRDGLIDYPFIKWSGNEVKIKNYLCRPWSKNPIIPHFLGCIWESRADLNSKCDAQSENGAIYLIEWWRSNGSFEYKGLQYEV